MIIQGDCLEKLKEIADSSIDAVVTDPPYGLSFMGKKWDYDVPSVEIWQECLRVLKPGGYLLAFAGTRTQHRMAVRIEDAGFEIRDMIAWVYGSGFPKSLNVGKSVNQLETNEWSKIGKALDNIDQKSIMDVWKTNAKPAGIQLSKSLTEVGSNTPKKFFVPDIAVLYSNQKNELLNATIAEMRLKGLSLILEEDGIIAVESAGQTIELLPENARLAVKLSESQNLKCWNIFTAQCDVKEWLNENTEVNLKVDEALKTLRGNKKYSNEEITNVLCAELTDILKLTILNQSKTFQNLDTNQKTECASAINVIITEYTAENLISNTVDILKSKAVDKLQGNEREITGTQMLGGNAAQSTKEKGGTYASNTNAVGVKPIEVQLTKGTSPYEGWGTALKPALEPITVARKPLGEKTVAENCIKWGTGGINIDGSRVGTTEDQRRPSSGGDNGLNGTGTFKIRERKVEEQVQHSGRFPANLIHDGSDEVVELFPNSNGSAARFFYCAKASKSERNKGCEGLEEKAKVFNGQSDKPSEDMKDVEKRFTTLPKANNHPTVKPVALMEYLVNLVSREGSVILDPFAGSGTTGIACKKLGREFIGIELDSEYIKIAEARITYWQLHDLCGPDCKSKHHNIR